MSTGHLRPYFLSLSQAAGLNHNYIVGPTTEPCHHQGELCKHDFTIQPHFLERALAHLLPD
ncbi:MAG: hypothetical protein F6K03_15705 [Kamptonema sp. SIO4C4]|nr:hypothetical protein [Kamptonema sp. SIO4C4]